MKIKPASAAEMNAGAINTAIASANLEGGAIDVRIDALIAAHNSDADSHDVDLTTELADGGQIDVAIDSLINSHVEGKHEGAILEPLGILDYQRAESDKNYGWHEDVNTLASTTDNSQEGCSAESGFTFQNEKENIKLIDTNTNLARRSLVQTILGDQFISFRMALDDITKLMALVLYQDGQHIGQFRYNGANLDFTDGSTTTTLQSGNTNNEFHHICLFIDVSENKIFFWIDGKPKQWADCNALTGFSHYFFETSATYTGYNGYLNALYIGTDFLTAMSSLFAGGIQSEGILTNKLFLANREISGCNIEDMIFPSEIQANAGFTDTNDNYQIAKTAPNTDNNANIFMKMYVKKGGKFNLHFLMKSTVAKTVEIDLSIRTVGFLGAASSTLFTDEEFDPSLSTSPQTYTRTGVITIPSSSMISIGIYKKADNGTGDLVIYTSFLERVEE
ncbi:hypothetical protein [Candidatus Lokiarchaeum ossiferum]|uniref:hypothetical protein n=1 Tax=Candidatus Lokiarchaeum ossiferum TaxID=2951803 RepID=UPI00352DB2CC